MRVIGNIYNTPFKITVFKHNQRFTVKFESGMYELGFRLREGGRFQEFADVERFVNAGLIYNVKRQFQEMHRAALQSFASLEKESVLENEFEMII